MALDFPSSPSVGTIYPNPAVAGQPQYTWDGEKWTSGTGFGNIYIADTAPAAPVGSLWFESDTGLLYVRYNDGTSTQWVIACPQPDISTFLTITAQSLTVAQQVQARQNIYAAPFDAMAFNGMQVNGSCEISQENGTTAISVGGYLIDCWTFSKAGTAVVAAAQIKGQIAYGSNYFLGCYVTTAQAAMAAGDFCVLGHPIEGWRIARLAWGTPGAQPLTIAFWSDHHRPGTYTVSVTNITDRSYTIAYTHNVSDVAQYNVITIPGPTDGTWKTETGVGLYVFFTMACGSTYTSPSNNVWNSGYYLAGVGQVNAVAATTDYFRITGLLVLPGLEAPSAARSSLIMRPYDQELRTCQRYFETGVQEILYLAGVSCSAAFGTQRFLVTKATTPGVTLTGYMYYSGGTGVSITPTLNMITRDHFEFLGSPVTNWNGWYNTGVWKASARI